MTLSRLSIMACVNVLKRARAHQCYGRSSYLNYFPPYVITGTRYERVVQAQRGGMRDPYGRRPFFYLACGNENNVAKQSFVNNWEKIEAQEGDISH